MPSPIPQSAQAHQPHKNAKTVIKNPYLKKEQVTTATTVICSKQKLAAKYSHSAKGVEGITAAELRRKRIRQQPVDGSTSDDDNRLCLFRRGSQYNNANDGVFPLENDITELAGEGGSGKTQICLSLAVDCVIQSHWGAVKEHESSSIDQSHTASNDSLHPKAIYLTTKNSISTIATRLRTMIHARLSSRTISQPISEALESQITSQTLSTMQHIYLIPIQNEEQLMEFLVSSLPDLMRRLNVRLVVLDDIAVLYRFSDPSPNVFDKSSTFIRDRSGDLWTVSSVLRRLATLHECPVVVVNQVTAAPPSLEGGTLSNGSWEGNLPALGLVWSYCVGTRIMLRRGHNIASTKVDGEKERQSVCLSKSIRRRFARVLQSVNIPIDQDVGFVVEDTGVRLEK